MKNLNPGNFAVSGNSPPLSVFFDFCLAVFKRSACVVFKRNYDFVVFVDISAFFALADHCKTFRKTHSGVVIERNNDVVLLVDISAFFVDLDGSKSLFARKNLVVHTGNDDFESV